MHFCTRSSNMMKPLTKLFLFVLLMWILNHILAVPIRKTYFGSNGGNSGAQINYALRDKSDVLIIGSSRAAHHYNSESIANITGLRVYNAGKEGVNSSYQYGLMSMYLRDNTPKLIVYDVCDFGPNLDSGTTNLFPYYYRDREVRSIIRDRDSYADLKFQFPVYAFNGKIIDLIYDKLMKKDMPNMWGFEPRNKKINTRDLDLLASQVRKFQGVDMLAAKHFEENIVMIREKKVPIIFVLSPTLLDETLSGLEIVQRVADEHGIEFYDYRVIKTYHQRFDYFYDALHLNAVGADVFSKDVAAIISEKLNKVGYR